jgi:hypothetical protein
MRRIIELPIHQITPALPSFSLSLQSPGSLRIPVPATMAVTKGMTLLDSYPPVPVFSPRAHVAPSMTLSFNYGGDNAPSSVVDSTCHVADFQDAAAIQTFLAKNPAARTYADPAVATFGVNCNFRACVGGVADVRTKLGVKALWDSGLTGGGVRVAFVDTGVMAGFTGPDGAAIVVDPTILYPASIVPGSTSPSHGSMCAYDTLIVAPAITVLDVPLLQKSNGTWQTFLSDALQAYASLIAYLNAHPGPLVVSNSWGLYDTAMDAPLGSTENYSANPSHPFNRQTAALVAAGADVVFAAGNCGADCPAPQCGGGSAIHGANSSPVVICVAAVDTTDTRLGYSSQAPGGLDPHKPDLCGYSQFLGSQVEGAGTPDNGTSAACPIVSGVVALLRTKSTVAPPTLADALTATARQVGAAPWNGDFGYGIVDLAAAASRLNV